MPVPPRAIGNARLPHGHRLRPGWKFRDYSSTEILMRERQPGQPLFAAVISRAAPDGLA